MIQGHSNYKRNFNFGLMMVSWGWVERAVRSLCPVDPNKGKVFGLESVNLKISSSEVS